MRLLPSSCPFAIPSLYNVGLLRRTRPEMEVLDRLTMIDSSSGEEIFREAIQGASLQPPDSSPLPFLLYEVEAMCWGWQTRTG